MGCVVRVALAASCLLICQGAISAGDNGPGDKLPEPALHLAKEASKQVTAMELEWLKRAEALSKRTASLSAPGGGTSNESLREQAERLLATAKGLVADSKQAATELDRFKDALRKAAYHYGKVADLYKGQAGQASADEVKGDYLELAKVYEGKARSAEERGKGLSLPAGTKDKEELIEEGNLFLERFVDALAIGSMTGPDRSLFAGRLAKHAERCKTLKDELSRLIEKVLEAADAPEIKAKVEEARKDGSLPPPPKKELPLLAGAVWSCRFTVQGAEYVQFLRFDADGTCVQAVYRAGPKGKGALVRRGISNYQLDADGCLYLKQGGFVFEMGRVELLGKDQWSYEVRANLANPEAVGTRLVFSRETRP